MDDDKHQKGPAEQLLFAAEIRPHRSLTPTGFKRLMMAVALLSAIASLPFYMMGAWPVVGFFGLDVLLLWLAFRWSYRTARAREEVSVTALELFVRKISHWGDVSEWRFNPLWVRLKREEDEDYGLMRLAILERNRSLDVGGFLSPPERADFAEAFAKALAEARRGPRYGH
ncbi:membrane protein [Agaricicola taiwanensis]|uniref:Membrane protein n=1 Tax=Agaricicola taiwanensis TaxID=591372 RepID=A0A8J2YEX5_9RHOB|nr:DUF2244 domain-containing protein [Agaricicola taiwanensis]GGE29820.1 membrane protein [Agaricicola taiwanensis]